MIPPNEIQDVMSALTLYPEQVHFEFDVRAKQVTAVLLKGKWERGYGITDPRPAIAFSKPISWDDIGRGKAMHKAAEQLLGII